MFFGWFGVYMVDLGFIYIMFLKIYLQCEKQTKREMHGNAKKQKS